jgi:hypothetical protein
MRSGKLHKLRAKGMARKAKGEERWAKSALHASKNLFDQFYKSWIGEGKRNERNGDEDVHLEMEASKFFFNNLEAFFKKLSRHKLLLQIVLERNFQKLLLLEDFFSGSLLHVADGGFQSLRQNFGSFFAAQAFFEHVKGFAR